MQQQKNNKQNGVALLPVVMVLGIMALAIAVGIMAVSFNETSTSQGLSQSSRALFFAEAGARDALTRIARDRTYTCATTDCYSIDFSANGCSTGNDCAKVSVSAGDGSTGNEKIITSTGSTGLGVRKMQVTVTLDGGTSTASLQNGVITGAVWAELTN